MIRARRSARQVGRGGGVHIGTYYAAQPTRDASKTLSPARRPRPVRQAEGEG
jgi:hypothetical protein